MCVSCWRLFEKEINLKKHFIQHFCLLFFSYLLLLSVVSSIMPESLPLELWELCVDWRPRDPFSLSIPPSLSLSPESFPLERPSISSKLGPLWSPDETADPDPPLGDEPPPAPLPCSWGATLALGWPPLVFGEFNPSDSASWSLFFSSALATRPRVLLLGVDLELS